MFYLSTCNQTKQCAFEWRLHMRSCTAESMLQEGMAHADLNMPQFNPPTRRLEERALDTIDKSELQLNGQGGSRSSPLRCSGQPRGATATKLRPQDTLITQRAAATRVCYKRSIQIINHKSNPLILVSQAVLWGCGLVSSQEFREAQARQWAAEPPASSAGSAGSSTPHSKCNQPHPHPRSLRKLLRPAALRRPRVPCRCDHRGPRGPPGPVTCQHPPGCCRARRMPYRYSFVYLTCLPGTELPWGPLREQAR
mmetsp:Transcript_17226/g.51534  ORF Transcript_17226/g.51534 Transcript_17226/m.51534 type:complete len:253 (+) Transcript_17226:1806-2564(+)